ncbi:MAG: ribonuclease R, partial [Bacteroidales bacterium]|nr:ribonuclease R [Bacteroidales bacterium]
MVEWPNNLNNPVGKVLQILGKPGENNVEMQSILAEFDFPLSFPATVEKAAENIPSAITDEEIAHRRDFRNDITFTIDPADAKDFDDALSFRRLDNGNYLIGVHIADVSHYVTPGSPIDNEAYRRATSVYLVDRTIPMLPEKLCNNLCSLRPNEDKLCFSAVFEMDDNANVISRWLGKTVIHSNRRFSYEETQQVIETGEGDLKDEILKLNQLATILKENRHKTGAINFESVEVKLKLDENAKPIGVYIKEQKEANFLIEEFMLLANKGVAEFVGKPQGKSKAKTFVYRVHDEPNPEKLNTFVQFVRKLGYRMNVANRQSLAKSFNNLFEATEGKGEQNMIDAIAIRTMAKAFYSTENIGHYGLAFPYYTHFTSPIRRYPDLMVHRLLEHYLNGGKSADIEAYEERCKHASLMERKAVEAERTSVKYKQAEFLSDKIGQVFPALISGVSKWGIYAEIEGNKCEGMISLGDLNDDFYYLDEDNYQVIGRRYGKTYKLGSPVTIRVKRVDMQRKQLDFTLVNDDKDTTRRPKGNADKSYSGEHDRRSGKSDRKARGGKGRGKRTKKQK